VLRDAAAFGTADAEARHRTRKRLKRFRYGLEFLLPLLGRKSARRLYRAVCRALQALGDLNDLHTAETLFRAQAAADARAWFAVGWLSARQVPAQADAASALALMAQCDRRRLPWRRLRRRRS
jgi:CHAD domain-containing protein